MIYLASPYAHSSNHVRNMRAHAMVQVTAALVAKGMPAFSPVAYGHLLTTSKPGGCTPPMGWYMWDMLFLERCDSMSVITLPGYAESKGVAMEIARAEKLNLPWEYWDPAEIVTFTPELMAVLSQPSPSERRSTSVG